MDTVLPQKVKNEAILRSELIDHLVKQKQVFFCYQQNGDPDFTYEERKSIAEDLLDKNILKFLHRFGRFLSLTHLKYFEEIKNLPQTGIDKCNKKELCIFLDSLKKNKNNKIIKNRRYYAMKNNYTDYFNEREVMSRQPLLYEHLIGQYMTDSEKRKRDSVAAYTCFSDVLLAGIHDKQVAELCKKQKTDWLNTNSDSDSEITSLETQSNQTVIDENLFPQIPKSYSMHWGEFSDDNNPSSDNNHQNYITAEEKYQLRKEFFGIMESNFLDGLDSSFNYEAVDNNSEFDDLLIQSQDEEDRYFEDEEESESIEIKTDTNLNKDNISEDEYV